MNQWSESPPQAPGYAWRSERVEGAWRRPELCTVAVHSYCVVGFFTPHRHDACKNPVRWLAVDPPCPPEAGRLAPLPIGTRVLAGCYREVATVVEHPGGSRLGVALNREIRFFDLAELELIEPPSQEPR